MKQVKILFAIVAGFLFPALSNASDSSEKITEKRSSQPYHSIIVLGNAQIKLVQDEMPGLSLSGTKDQLMNMSTYLRNDTLYIIKTNNYDVNGKRTKISVNVDNLTLLDVKGNTLVEADGYINTDILSIKVDKGAVVSLDVRALKVKSEILGCGSVRLSGTVGTFLSDCEGCGMIDLAEMRVLDRAI